MRYDNLIEITHAVDNINRRGIQQLIEWKHKKERSKNFDDYTFEEMPNRLHRLSRDLANKSGFASHSAFLCISQQRTCKRTGVCFKEIKMIPYAPSPESDGTTWFIPSGNSTKLIDSENAVEYMLACFQTLSRILRGNKGAGLYLIRVMETFMNISMMPTNNGIQDALKSVRDESEEHRAVCECFLNIMTSTDVKALEERFIEDLTNLTPHVPDGHSVHPIKGVDYGSVARPPRGCGGDDNSTRARKSNQLPLFDKRLCTKDERVLINEVLFDETGEETICLAKIPKEGVDNESLVNAYKMPAKSLLKVTAQKGNGFYKKLLDDYRDTIRAIFPDSEDNFYVIYDNEVQAAINIQMRWHLSPLALHTAHPPPLSFHCAGGAEDAVRRHRKQGNTWQGGCRQAREQMAILCRGP